MATSTGQGRTIWRSSRAVLLVGLVAFALAGCDVSPTGRSLTLTVVNDTGRPAEVALLPGVLRPDVQLVPTARALVAAASNDMLETSALPAEWTIVVDGVPVIDSLHCGEPQVALVITIESESVRYRGATNAAECS